MRLSLISRATSSLWIWYLLSFTIALTAAERVIESRSLMSCMANSKFSASLFQVTFSPDTRRIDFTINGVSDIDSNVTAIMQVYAYGYKVLEHIIDPCKEKLLGMCPMKEGNLDLQSNVDNISQEVIDSIPGIAFQVPDLDGKVQVRFNITGTDEQVACVEANLSNKKTVDQKAVGWTTAVIVGLGLVASAITSGLGHDNTAAHVAANAMSLFGYFQAQAMIAMTAVALPPIVASWTQNFDWCMGIIRVRFMQNIFHWYIHATGGTPTNLMNNLDRVSVSIQKRSLQAGMLMARGANALARRSNNDNKSNRLGDLVTVTGIERVAFKSKVEETNFFLTGLSFFIIFLVSVSLCVAAFKWGSEYAIKMKWIHGTKFQQFRAGWLTCLKGILYRLILIGFPQMSILCLWELTVRDSKAAVVLAIFFFLTVVGVLTWAAIKVIQLAQRSVAMHKNPAYILYSDPSALNRWGFLYIQYRATAYYFVVPALLYILIKATFIAFGQSVGTVQAVALLIVEFGYLIGVAKMKPWMDKKTNIFNISIASINTLNSIFLLVFTGIFKEPGLVKGVMGVVFFIVNAVFALVLLILVLASSCYALYSKNPETRYQPMRDDRGSFIKSNQVLGSTELDALGKTARGDTKEARLDLDDDRDFTLHDPSHVPLPPSSASTQAPSYHEQPIQPSMPYFPSSRGDTRGPQYSQRTGPSDLPLLNAGGGSRTPSRNEDRSPSPFGQGPTHSGGYSKQSEASRWHVGAGYDH
ncbi:hypothetical protein BDZ91DRAFT_797689 [Kalaharituber pfeilii]|nr:hypothetical protein BDZ91DRAFT_797689 [Kalaharituber pfeilii]